jgi:NAD(P)H-flavin reductase
VDIGLVTEKFNSGLRFYIGRKKGSTARLGMEGKSMMLVITEAPYPSLPIDPLATYKHLVCIAGGTGISTMMPVLRARASAASGRTILYWSCRSPALVHEVAVGRLSTVGVEVQIRVGKRWEVTELVCRETCRETSSNGDVMVIVSGPSSMADDVRHAIVQANKIRGNKGRKGVIRLVEECFNW